MCGHTENNANPEKAKKGENDEEKEVATEEPTSGPGNLNYVFGKQRQPKESGENAKGALIYEKEPQTWKCAQCEKNTQHQMHEQQRT